MKKIDININIISASCRDVHAINGKYYYYFNKFPDYFNIGTGIKNTIESFLRKKGFESIEYNYANSFKDIHTVTPYNTIWTHHKKEILIVINKDNVSFLYSKSSIKPYIKEFSKDKYKYTADKQLYIILPASSGFKLNSHTLKRTEFIPNNYNTDFLPIHETIKENLNKDKSGLYLFYGIPGTGKSSYIASLTQMNTNKKFIYLPSSLFSQLDNPTLMEVFLNNRNSIFIIEDGEKLLINRETENNSPISALLNMSDGLIGQLLNSQIICTFNTSLDKIDEALTRNGRLICMYEFKALEKERAIELAKMINIPFEHIKEDTTLANVYNQSPVKKEIKSSRKAIGFSK